MPLHSRTHSHAQAQSQDNSTSSGLTAPSSHPTSSLIQAAQTLSSIATPNLRLQTVASNTSSSEQHTPVHQSSVATSLHPARQLPSQQQQIYQSPTDIYPQQRPSDPTQAQPVQLPSATTGTQYAAYHQPQQQPGLSSGTSGSQTYLPYPGTSSNRQPAQSPVGTQITSPESSHTMSQLRTGGLGAPGYVSGGNPDANISSSSIKYTPSTVAISKSENKYNHPNPLPSYNTATTNPLDPYGGTMGSANGRYLAPWGIFALDWCKWPVAPGGGGLGGYGRLAIGSYSEDSHNSIQILNTSPTAHSARGESIIEFTKVAEAIHTYPITRILWEPPTPSKPFTDLLATSGDHLRLWSLPNTNAASAPSTSNTINRSASSHHQGSTQKLTPLALLSNSKSQDSVAPLTSLDWNTISPALIITSSIDTTCTVWDIPTLTAKTQLIAHDKEVYDVRFMSGSVDIFASCGADGSVRLFDLRSLEHSTIIYEPPTPKPISSSGEGSSPPYTALTQPPPLLRLAASPHDHHLLATFAQDSNIVRILDIRQPGQALIKLHGHSNNVNCVEWNPQRRGSIAAGGDDCLVLVWDLTNNSTRLDLDPGKGIGSSTGGSTVQGQQESHARSPIMAWRSEWEVNNISWSPPTGYGGKLGDPEWLGCVGGRGIWGVKV